ncbi:hypothetical protein [Halorussus lipolyticus]|uniref:hypothetical protein n=1 Tax=Halorussus lipolyticus TaxID=3034024 RepID=UPI0023E7D2FE|nr:hypothetical protein [Halorussus sp. DT80]
MSDKTTEQILGTTKISDRWRISFLEAVREELAGDDDEVEEGDRLVYKISDGKVVIELA